MAIKNRLDLKSLFKSGAVPTQKDFCDLIDSMLVKRDEQFFGCWNSGIAYRPGDVVLYGKSIYQLVVKEEEMSKEDEAEELTEEVAQYAQQLAPDETTLTEVKEKVDVSVCSTIPPSEDPRWCLLQLDIDDDDWEILEDGEEGLMCAKVYGKIGMGTKEPSGRVDMLEMDKGQFIFNPTDTDVASTQLINLSPECAGNFLAEQVNADYATWSTNVPIGYVFKKIPAMEKDDSSDEESDTAKEETTEVLDLMLITSDEMGMPMIGLGTLDPKAMIDIYESETRQLQINSDKHKLPEVLWVNLDPGSDKNYMSARVTLRNAEFITNADNGFQFKVGADYDSFCNKERDENKTVLAIKEDGSVGIGTETPMAKLQITDQESGDVRVNLDRDNPSLSIINLRPKTMDNYLTMGADNDHAVLITDAPNGFVFKTGEECGNGNEGNINQGEKIVYIHRDAKIGIGIHPNEYELDVFGKARANSLYLDTDSSKIMRTGDLGDVLPDLCKLNPIKFKWDPKKTNQGGEGEQIGFFANQVGEYFPELVTTHADATKSVAYPNMVAVLVQAIKEQQALIKKMEQRIDALEDGTS